MLLKLCEEKRTFCNQSPLQKIKSTSTLRCGNYVCWSETCAMLVSKIQYTAGYSGRKQDAVPLDYTSKLHQYYFPDVRQPPYQINEKPFFTALLQLPVAPQRLCEHYT